MKIKIRCPDGSIKTPQECLDTENSMPYPILKKLMTGFMRESKPHDKIRFGTTKLTTICLRQSYYQLTEEQVLDLDKVWILSRGHAFHEYFNFEQNEVFVQKKFKDFDVLGFIDGVEGDTLYELKTTKNIPSTPQNHHALQAQAYYSMYPERDKIQKLLLVYLNMSTIKSFEVPKRDITPWIESRGRQLTTAIKTKTPPPKEKSWLCNYCVFKDICENHTVEKRETVKRAVDKIINNKKEKKKMEQWKELFDY